MACVVLPVRKQVEKATVFLTVIPSCGTGELRDGGAELIVRLRLELGPMFPPKKVADR